VIEYSLADDRK